MHHARLDARRRIQFTVLALILIAAGIAFGFVPGIPGFILVLFGAAFIATQSRAVARGLDWFEIHLRRMMRHS